MTDPTSRGPTTPPGVASAHASARSPTMAALAAFSSLTARTTDAVSTKRAHGRKAAPRSLVVRARDDERDAMDGTGARANGTTIGARRRARDAADGAIGSREWRMNCPARSRAMGWRVGGGR